MRRKDHRRTQLKGGPLQSQERDLRKNHHFPPSYNFKTYLSPTWDIAAYTCNASFSARESHFEGWLAQFSELLSRNKSYKVIWVVDVAQ